MNMAKPKKQAATQEPDPEKFVAVRKTWNGKLQRFVVVNTVRLVVTGLFGLCLAMALFGSIGCIGLPLLSLFVTELNLPGGGSIMLMMTGLACLLFAGLFYMGIKACKHVADTFYANLDYDSQAHACEIMEAAKWA